jgi:hypothetical protein
VGAYITGHEMLFTAAEFALVVLLIVLVVCLPQECSERVFRLLCLFWNRPEYPRPPARRR